MSNPATGPTSPITVDGLVNGQEYRLKVRARNSLGWGPYSEWSDPFTPDEGLVVSLLGNDTTGSGTVAAPYRTVKKALQTASPEETIYVRDVPNGGITKYTAESFDASCSGTALNPKVVRPYPGEQPIFEGQMSFGTSAQNADYIQFIGNRDIRINPAADTIIFEYGASVNDGAFHVISTSSTGTILDGCIVDRLMGYGGSVIADGWNGGTGQWGAVETKILGCLIRNVGTATNLTTSVPGHDHGIYANYTLNCEYAYNVFSNIQGGWGIHCYTESTSGRHVDGTYAHHNTIVDTRDGGIILAGQTLDTTKNSVIDNNLCHSCGDNSLITSLYSYTTYWGHVNAVGVNNTGNNNHSHLPGDGHVQPGMTGWTVINTTTGDPLFVNLGSLDFRIQTGSPAEGKGAFPTVV